MSDQEHRMLILEMIEQGRISAEEGLNLLQALGEGGEESTERAEVSDSIPDTSESHVEMMAESLNAEKSAPGRIPPEAQKWRRFWHLPLWSGVLLTVLSGYGIYRTLMGSGFNLWTFCSGTFFILGLFLIFLGVQARTSPWIHLRVKQADGEFPQRIALSFPLPLRLAVWFLKIFGRHIPYLEETALDEVLIALGETARDDNPLYVKVDEGSQGEQVEVFIG